MSLPERLYDHSCFLFLFFGKDDAVSARETHLNVRPGRKTTTAASCEGARRRRAADSQWRARAKACVCDGCCHTEADGLARCEGGDLPGLSGHV